MLINELINYFLRSLAAAKSTDIFVEIHGTNHCITLVGRSTEGEFGLAFLGL